MIYDEHDWATFRNLMFSGLPISDGMKARLLDAFGVGVEGQDRDRHSQMGREATERDFAREYHCLSNDELLKSMEEFSKGPFDSPEPERTGGFEEHKLRALARRMPREAVIRVLKEFL